VGLLATGAPQGGKQSTLKVVTAQSRLLEISVFCGNSLEFSVSP